MTNTTKSEARDYRATSSKLRNKAYGHTVAKQVMDKINKHQDEGSDSNQRARY